MIPQVHSPGVPDTVRALALNYPERPDTVLVIASDYPELPDTVRATASDYPERPDTVRALALNYPERPETIRAIVRHSPNHPEMDIKPRHEIAIQSNPRSRPSLTLPARVRPTTIPPNRSSIWMRGTDRVELFGDRRCARRRGRCVHPRVLGREVMVLRGRFARGRRCRRMQNRWLRGGGLDFFR